MSSRDFTDQIRGILQSAKDGATPTSHQAWVKGVLQLLQAAQRGEQIAVPEVEDYEASQVESSRHFGAEISVQFWPGSAFCCAFLSPLLIRAGYAAKFVAEGCCRCFFEAVHRMKVGEQGRFEELRKAQPRPGERLSERKLCELGAAFERQPFGSDTCAIHSLNNLLQPKRSPEEAAAKSEEEKASCGFVPPRQLSLLRADSGLSWPEEQRTGMFDVEAIKLAARSKGFEVIDVEPKPTWQDSEVSAFADAATQVKEVSQESRAHDKEHQKEKEEESPKQEKDLQDAIRHEEAHTGPVLPPSQARAASQLDLSRWNAQQATRALLAAPRQVARELQVLQLTVSEQEARASLEATEWNFVSAVGHQSDKLLQHAKADCVESEARLTSASAFSALSATDWDVRRSAELLLLKERAEAEHISVDLSSAAAALRETNSVNEALLVVQLIHELHKENKDVDEAFAAKLLQHGDSCATARQIALVRSEFPSAPLAICAEALRRGEGQAAACILLKDFEDKVCSLVTALAHRVVSSRGREVEELTASECKEVSMLALEAAEWNPDLAFALAESYALSVIQVRREGLLLRTCVPCCFCAGCLAITSALLDIDITPKAFACDMMPEDLKDNV
eukprot:g24929.t1